MIYILIPALIIIIVIFVYVQSIGYRTSEYCIGTDKKLPGEVKFVVLSDLHDTDVTHDHNRKLLASIAEAEPDFVILAGDIVTSYAAKRRGSAVSYEFLADLAKEHKVYYGLGNHEQRFREDEKKFPGKYTEFVNYVKGLGIHLLSDAYADIEDKNIRIYGFDIPMEYYKRGVRNELPEGILTDTLGKPDGEMFNILLAHTPDHFAAYAAFGPDLVLSGHLHGGIIGVPGIGGMVSPQLSLFPKYAQGLYEKGSSRMIVSRGIGWHSVPVRIFNKAEIISVTLRPERVR